MSQIAYVNGSYGPISHAGIHIEDRGFQFADGVYEGIAVRHGKLVDLGPHLDRLWRSMDELRIAPPMGRGPMTVVFKEVVRRNRVTDGFLYVQVTRGSAKRDHPFPAHSSPSLIVTCRRLSFDAVAARAKKGVSAVSQPDIRWGRCDVKSVSLLPNILAKQAAREAGGFEAVLVDADGYVTEGSSTNIWMVRDDGVIMTRPTEDNILAGITRASVMTIAKELQMKVRDQAFTLEDALSASELFLTSTTAGATPIVMLNGQKIGDGTPGPVATRLMAAYMDYMDAGA